MKNDNLLYTEIRTANMLPDRSADVHFDDNYTEDGVTFPSRSQTNQQFLQECDINYIVKQNQATGMLSHVNPIQPQWGDFGDSTDYQSALNYLKEANEAFMSYPADLRARFNNDPGQLLDFVTNPENIEECVKLGLAVVTKPADATFSSAQLDQLDRAMSKNSSKQAAKQPVE